MSSLSRYVIRLFDHRDLFRVLAYLLDLNASTCMIQVTILFIKGRKKQTFRFCAYNSLSSDKIRGRKVETEYHSLYLISSGSRYVCVFASLIDRGEYDRKRRVKNRIISHIRG